MDTATLVELTPEQAETLEPGDQVWSACPDTPRCRTCSARGDDGTPDQPMLRTIRKMKHNGPHDSNPENYPYPVWAVFEDSEMGCGRHRLYRENRPAMVWPFEPSDVPYYGYRD